MKSCSFSVIFVFALLSEGYVNAAVMPATKTEDASSEQDILAPFLSEEVAENGFTFGGSRAPKGGSAKIIIVDTGVWKGIRGLARRDAGPDLSSDITIARRDTMRCMVGRVYRPCWEV